MAEWDWVNGFREQNTGLGLRRQELTSAVNKPYVLVCDCVARYDGMFLMNDL